VVAPGWCAGRRLGQARPGHACRQTFFFFPFRLSSLKNRSVVQTSGRLLAAARLRSRSGGIVSGSVGLIMSCSYVRCSLPSQVIIVQHRDDPDLKVSFDARCEFVSSSGGQTCANQQ
jgi:hypothetical protein